MGKLLMLAGGLILLTGIIVYLFETKDVKWLSWFGNLPGDIKIEKENFKFYFPFTSMIIVSILLTLLMRLASFIFNHFSSK
ncbi:MAG: hypothetical protein OHK0036_16690 [Bacteroidia bacterium]